ncbi:hypothetical protein E1212_19840 [Jiangella ureilytica]|uniref:SMI1/KNR4 family protein n=1 Tax=Jiangella ureilytica TaxID=2530374 RepID=A0A4R4RHN0_9ACTN|nr:hypothetical protein [Jiangella ureilytica]TDC48870.1 hypothetical protein E1212_19840 [Jiangella ureilytica]
MSGRPWAAGFDVVDTGAAVPADALAAVERELGRLLGRGGPFRLPPALAALLSAGVESCVRTVDGAEVEFEWLGSRMPAHYEGYAFDSYMPAAVPIALDGGGGAWCLDARADARAGARAGDGDGDGDHPVVWVHTGTLSWSDGAWRPVAPGVAALLADRTPR